MNDEEKKFNVKAVIRFTFIFTLVLLTIYYYNELDIKKYLTRESVEAFLKPFGYWIPFIYIVIFTLGMMFYVPASIFLVTIGTLLGPGWGSVWGIIGCYLASFILFFMARRINLHGIKAKLGNKWDKFNQKLEEDGFFYLALIRSTSIFPFSVICYGSGITSIRTKDYIKGTIIGCIPQIIIYCYIIPMVISQSFSNDKAITIAIITLVWASLFAIAYGFHKREKLQLQLSSQDDL
ncbi:MAG: VTT domain-containing protein [Candidatus Sericytochromatia bacterium]